MICPRCNKEMKLINAVYTGVNWYKGLFACEDCNVIKSEMFEDLDKYEESKQ